MTKPTFTRKIVNNRGSLQVNIPAEIVRILKLKAGSSLVFSYEDESFTCKKVDDLVE